MLRAQGACIHWERKKEAHLNYGYKVRGLPIHACMWCCCGLIYHAAHTVTCTAPLELVSAEGSWGGHLNFHADRQQSGVSGLEGTSPAACPCVHASRPSLQRSQRADMTNCAFRLLLAWSVISAAAVHVPKRFQVHCSCPNLEHIPTQLLSIYPKAVNENCDIHTCTWGHT